MVLHRLPRESQDLTRVTGGTQEDYGCFGIILGVLKGCAAFWCLCQGFLTIYCGAVPSTETKTTKRGCEKCMKNSADVVNPTPIQIDRG